MDRPGAPSATAIAALKDILGPDGWLESAADRAAFETDFRRIHHGGTPLVLLPDTTARVAEVVRLCSRERIALVPQGGNTSYCGGATPRPAGNEVLISLRRLRLTGFFAAGVVVLLALPASQLDVGPLVTSAFAVAASTFCPLLVLGIWWSGLTRRGAMAGMSVGLASSAGVMALGVVLSVESGLLALLLTSPVLVSVPLAFATMEDPGEPVIVFYRSPQAPDMTIESADVDRAVVESVPILWFPTSCLSEEPSRSTIHDLLAWRSRRTHTVLDLDWRPQFWRSAADATAELDQVLDHVTMAIGNRAA